MHLSRGGAERLGDRGSEAGSVLTAEIPILGLGLTNRTVRSSPEPKLGDNPLSHPGALDYFFIYKMKSSNQ